MNPVLIVRIVGLVIFGIIGAFLGTSLHVLVNQIWVNDLLNNIHMAIISTVVFAILGFIITPWITIKPLQTLRKIFNRISAQNILGGLIGLILSLIIAALLAYPLSLLPQPLGSILPVVTALVFAYLGIAIFSTRQGDFVSVLRSVFTKGGLKLGRTHSETERRILVDTSAIIDGRIADISKTGFVTGNLIIPRFVLNELQYVSDSSDNLRRQRGRRGMDVLAELQKNEALPVTISDMDVEGVREVDEKLVVLARQLQCPILTNDFNLNRIAELQGVRILNINELANAVKSILIPGETLEMKIIQEGKEQNQGVSYLEDGTMVVIENGQRYLNQTIKVTVTKVLQTAAGRMVFAKPEID